ncbi:prepilin peptidase [Rickettsiales bacterium]|nr:prepilin peptidase [Rickettsiales bacterium]MDB2550838.1 prepilin peptidase [Rickettsiales bacterium]
MEIFLIIILGLIFGSFISMASYRLASEDNNIRDLIIRRSFCPKCNNILKIKNLFPILSWILQSGKCSYCNNKIPFRYILIEIFTAILFLISFLALEQEFNAHLLIILFVIIMLMIASVVDLEHYFIPNITQIILLILAILYHIFVTNNFDIKSHLLSAFLYAFFIYSIFYIFLIIKGKYVIGSDDLKFFPIAGIFLGMGNFVYFIAFLGISGIIYGMAWKFFTKEECFPFAPALSFALMMNLWAFTDFSYISNYLELIILQYL